MRITDYRDCQDSAVRGEVCMSSHPLDGETVSSKSWTQTTPKASTQGVPGDSDSGVEAAVGRMAEEGHEGDRKGAGRAGRD